MPKISLRSIVLLCVFVAIALVIYTQSVKSPYSEVVAGALSEKSSAQLSEFSVPQEGIVGSPIDELGDPELQQYMHEMVAELTSRFDRNVDDELVQLSLSDFRDYLVNSYPESGSDLFELMLLEAFSPAQAAAVLKTIAKMDGYKDWLSKNIATLVNMPAIEYEKKILDKRFELFGESTQYVWTSLDADVERRANLTIHVLDKAKIPIDNKLMVFDKILTREFSKDKLAAGMNEPGKIGKTQIFFGLDSVQAELEALAFNERQSKINNIRESLGFTKDEVEKMNADDTKQNDLWERGQQYIKARKALFDDGPSTVSEDLNTALDDLRVEYFDKFNAETIKAEERADFDRFSRERTHGLN